MGSVLMCGERSGKGGCIPIHSLQGALLLQYEKEYVYMHMNFTNLGPSNKFE